MEASLKIIGILKAKPTNNITHLQCPKKNCQTKNLNKQFYFVQIKKKAAPKIICHIPMYQLGYSFFKILAGLANAARND
jgi:hypothetical protein